MSPRPNLSVQLRSWPRCNASRRHSFAMDGRCLLKWLLQFLKMREEILACEISTQSDINNVRRDGLAKEQRQDCDISLIHRCDIDNTLYYRDINARPGYILVNISTADFDCTSRQDMSESYSFPCTIPPCSSPSSRSRPSNRSTSNPKRGFGSKSSQYLSDTPFNLLLPSTLGRACRSANRCW